MSIDSLKLLYNYCLFVSIFVYLQCVPPSPINSYTSRNLFSSKMQKNNSFSMHWPMIWRFDMKTSCRWLCVLRFKIVKLEITPGIKILRRVQSLCGFGRTAFPKLLASVSTHYIFSNFSFNVIFFRIPFPKYSSSN